MKHIKILALAGIVMLASPNALKAASISFDGPATSPTLPDESNPFSLDAET